ncbi:meiotic PUF family protein 1 [Schizosaccharomyces cryophilus OY26]|uniref:Meiotic PUF family protein 1 n=1 Tax=Schizosaccharomyces cryophilus (strain OY26 / ATCC MYA-4695 / CBS 11777 / NBRC 106824 / NRRL Y48691) TaxID=653667 RepID=S9VVI8_SCHCR|nr:meiotic PUF family protein 1 [Schizosaccharomyces cryophilus OY26]EPY51803.1 meiotic PUF family protein 1 [Schizosaccharomyces cryophilus OY26]
MPKGKEDTKEIEGRSHDLSRILEKEKDMNNLTSQIKYLEYLVKEQQKQIASSAIEVQKKGDQVRDLRKKLTLEKNLFSSSPSIYSPEHLLPKSLSAEIKGAAPKSCESRGIEPVASYDLEKFRKDGNYLDSKVHGKHPIGELDESFDNTPRPPLVLNKYKSNLRLNSQNVSSAWVPDHSVDPFSLGPPFLQPHTASSQAFYGSQFFKKGLENPVRLSDNACNQELPNNGIRKGTEMSETSSQNYKWKSEIEQIIFRNDQSASLYLQQKLKSNDQNMKHALIQCILPLSFTLMTNKFGNFLIQKCLEQCDERQLEGFAQQLKAHITELSTNAFGSHVVQKSFEIYPENFAASLIDQLMEQLPETLMQRHSCHVWQKFLETRRKSCALGTMDTFNKKLTGNWTQVATSEMGSLVVQTIFENCKEQEKRPCLNEIIQNTRSIISGQWGNWVIQHIIEHGSEDDQERVFLDILQNAEFYSTNQYASKVVERALRVNNRTFFNDYIVLITQPQDGWGRILLMDIASSQYGNYIVQYLLHAATSSQKRLLAELLKKHMVSLRGHKHGQKIALLVEKTKT